MKYVDSRTSILCVVIVFNMVGNTFSKLLYPDTLYVVWELSDSYNCLTSMRGYFLHIFFEDVDFYVHLLNPSIFVLNQLFVNLRILLYP